MTQPSIPALLRQMEEIALEAGALTLSLYGEGVDVIEKADASPVTEADRLAEKLILDRLRAIAPDTPVLAEEAASEGRIPDLGDRFFLVDPLDGTKEFINQTDEFTVNIALIQNGAPILGVVYAPALGKLYGGAQGHGAHLSRMTEQGDMPPPVPIQARAAPSSGMVAVASRSHRTAQTDAFLETLPIGQFAAAGSSLKFCLIAEGTADVYPRLGRTMEWDTGAGQAVLEAAGGRVVVFGEDNPLRYKKADRGYDNPHFIAWGA